ncbi:hypothetical protein NGRA_2996 [Nosema granulosis]|uniref:Uncharacterized protein n=1 Tax=Nosema granulosis TaxID=83296 RepID=A0A9P6KY37_9MICR|nr:hypothetical protein NGRA_2996 [Nosema granulosis]
MFIAPIYALTVFVYVEQVYLDITKDNSQKKIASIDIKVLNYRDKYRVKNKDKAKEAARSRYYAESTYVEPIWEEVEFFESSFKNIEYIKPTYKEVNYGEKNPSTSEEPCNRNDLISVKDKNISRTFRNFSKPIINLFSEPFPLIKLPSESKALEKKLDLIFQIKFISLGYKKRKSKWAQFFLELKKTLIELILYINDKKIEIKTKSFGTEKEVYDALYLSLENLYNFFCERNNILDLINFKETKFSPLPNTDIAEYHATGVLNNLFFPKEFVLKNNKFIKSMIEDMEKNRKRYFMLKKGFRRFDFVSVKIKDKTKIYRAKYYVLAVILQNFTFN